MAMLLGSDLLLEAPEERPDAASGSRRDGTRASAGTAIHGKSARAILGSGSTACNRAATRPGPPAGGAAAGVRRYAALSGVLQLVALPPAPVVLPTVAVVALARHHEMARDVTRRTRVSGACGNRRSSI